jgi:hypothetical protein
MVARLQIRKLTTWRKKQMKRIITRLSMVTTTHAIAVANIAVLVIGMLAFSATAMAQCADSFHAMAAAAASGQFQTKGAATPKSGQAAAASDNSVNTTIVGLWHIRFLVGDQQIQEAFQIWNAGGTEVHNPNVDPRSGSLCLGAWKEAAPQTFKLTHRVWFWSTDGVFQGTGNLSETLTLGDRGNYHSGSFTLDIFDPLGNLVAEVPGTVVGERISPN